MFTDNFAEWLNNINLRSDPPREGECLHFIEINGRTYYHACERGSDPEYLGNAGGSIRHAPDTYRLIEKTEQEVRFEVIAHYDDGFGVEPEKNWTRTIEMRKLTETLR